MELQTNPSDERQLPTKESPQPPSSSSATNVRLWRPAAQRNLRNQWSKLASLWRDWVSCSSAARSHATALVNSYLSRQYMDAMELGVLSGMPNIRKNASLKLFKQQVLQHDQLLSSYKDMVRVVTQMVNTSRYMRCYLKGTSSSPLAQFTSFAESQNDTGDAGGVPVFTFWPISHFEKVAKEFVEMFVLELNVKRLLLMELLSLGDGNTLEINRLHWSDEFYPGEIHDLGACSMFSKEDRMLVLSSLKKSNTEIANAQPRCKPDRDVIQVYLTTWIAEINIDRSRVDDIFALVGAEMHVTLS